MELKDFVKNTISEISLAILESQEELQAKGVIVNPEKVEVGHNGEKVLRSDGWRYVQNIEFDISITVDDKEETGAKGGIKVMGVELGAGAKSQNSLQQLNKIKFNLPVAFSTSQTPDSYQSKKSSMSVVGGSNKTKN